MIHKHPTCIQMKPNETEHTFEWHLKQSRTAVVKHADKAKSAPRLTKDVNFQKKIK